MPHGSPHPVAWVRLAVARPGVLALAVHFLHATAPTMQHVLGHLVTAIEQTEPGLFVVTHKVGEPSRNACTALRLLLIVHAAEPRPACSWLFRRQPLAQLLMLDAADHATGASAASVSTRNPWRLGSGTTPVAPRQFLRQVRHPPRREPPARSRRASLIASPGAVLAPGDDGAGVSRVVGRH